MLTPLLKEMRARNPKAHIGLVGAPHAEVILQNHPGLYDSFYLVNAPWVKRERQWANFFTLIPLIIRLRRVKWDWGIEVRGDLRQIAFLWLTGARSRIGYTFTGGNSLLTDAIPDDGWLKHIVDHHFQIIQYLYPDCRKETFIPELWLSDEEQNAVSHAEFIIGLHLGASLPLKRLSEKKAAELLSFLLRNYKSKLVIFDSPDQNGLPEKLINSLSSEERVQVKLIQTSLRGFITEIKKCRLFIGMDSAGGHIASALGVPVISIFGPAYAYFCAPVGEQVKVLMLPDSDVPCRPCGQVKCVHAQHHYCLEALPFKASDFLEFYREATSSGQLFSALAAELVKRNRPVSVLCGFPADKFLRNLPRCEIRNGIHIRRCGLRIAGKKNILYRARAYASFMAEALFRLLFSQKNTDWFGVTNPPFIVWVLALVSCIRRRGFHFMFLDIHPEGLIRMEKLNRRTWYVRLWQWLNRRSYHRISFPIVLGRDMVPLLSAVYKIPEDRFHYIPLWSAVETVNPISPEGSPFFAEYNPDNKFIVQYSGNMGLWHDMETFVYAANLMKNEAVRFVFIGNGIRRKSAEELSQKLALNNITWKDFVALGDLPQSLAACDASLITLNKGLQGVAVPSKLYGIMASGRAVLAMVPADSEIALTLKEYDCGVVIEPGDADGLANAIRLLMADPARCRQLGDNACLAYRKNYNLAVAADAVEKLLGL
ncbi:hypothetical protein CHS0354_035233 [Potamilus streckersoni]|uniref:Glycosyl transferase family 1 domain-containing protein n=1 Tax=Potamilus streckersoni TaxID=2493646 RepID=A0AAE0S314_9BIVA|nr:hypothetical protein CHS0354_035233 [Potamilus streckersoni]